MKRLLLLFLWHQVAGFEDRVVGGPKVDIHRFPYMAAIFQIRTQRVLCSGSIIHVKWILTAGHCKHPVDIFQVRVGSSVVGHGGDVYDPAEVITHPKYIGDKKFWLDIALIRLAHPIRLSRTVHTMRMARRHTKFPFGTGCEFTGYGKTLVASEDAKEGHLRHLGMPILQNTDCEKYRQFRQKTMLCVGFKNTNALACRGDSGGPLVCKGVIYGVAVTAYEGCNPAPNGFIRIVPFLNFIRNVTGMKV